MTTSTKRFGGVLIAAACCAVFALTAAEKNPPKVKDFMRVKLTASQKVLEGLALEDFDEIVKNSQQISLLTLAETWQVFQTPDYVQRSTEFRRSVDAMTEAARKKNLDGATLAYVKATTQCVDCHKYVRGVRMAKLER